MHIWSVFFQMQNFSHVHKKSLEGLHIFPDFCYTKHNYYKFFSEKFFSTYDGDINLSIFNHRLIAKWTKG